MKKVLFLLAVAALLSASSCTSEPIEEISQNSELIYTVESNFIDRSNARFAVNLDEECFYSELMAGQSIDAGNIIINKDEVENTVSISYQTEGEWIILETQLSIREYNEIDTPDFPMTGAGNPKIGQFEINESFDEETNSVTFTFSSEVTDQFSIAAHAVVADASGSSETAWSAGEEFPGRSWATYTLVDLSHCFVYEELE